MIKDKEKFEKFYKETFYKVVGFVNKHKIPQSYAEDLAQDIFLEIYDKYDDNILDKHGTFWRIVEFRVIDAKRKYYRTLKRFTHIPSKDTIRAEEAMMYLGLVPEFKELISYITNHGMARARRHYGKEFDSLVEKMQNFLIDNGFLCTIESPESYI